MSIYFIADLHFDDDAIIKLENRPFSSVEQMNQYMIDKWNSVITDEDTVYIVGDFIGSNVNVDVDNFVNILNGKKILIVGNHDKVSAIYENKQMQIIDYPIILDDFWIVSHEPMYVSENCPYANIFGHIHNSPMYKTVSSRSYCVSAERLDYTPIEFDVIKQRVKSENI